MKDLGGRSLSAVFWGGGGSVIRILLQFVVQVILARLLGPEQYGLFAIGSVVISFSNFFSDFGIAYGLIQKDRVSEDDLRLVFTWQLLIGSFVTLLVALLSDPIAAFFGDEEARDVVAALSIVCLLNAITAPAQNMLKRQLDFRRIQIAQVLGYVGGYLCVGVPMALHAPTVWALVTAWVVQAVLSFIILYAGAPHPVRPLLWFAGAGHMARYGVTVLVTNITNWVIGNIDRVVIGRLFASREIGLYATAYNILFGPTGSLLGIVQPVFFSATSRIASEHARVAEVYRALVSATAVFILPAFLCVAAVSETFVLALYGERWHDAGVLLRPLAVAMPFYLLWGFSTPLLWLGGAPQREFKTQLPIALLWVLASIATAHHSVLAVAWAVACLFALRCLVIFLVARRLIAISMASMWRALRGGVLLALICALAITLEDFLLRDAGVAPLLRLAIEIVLSAMLYVTLLFRVRGFIPSDCAELIDRLAEKSPAKLARWVRALPVMRYADVV